MITDFEKLYPGDATFNESSRILKARKIIAVISDYKRKVSNLALLDYGCSVGLMTRYFGYKFNRIVGVDVDGQAIRIARKRNRKSNVRFVLTKNERLPFKANSFDVVVFNQVYEHVSNPNLAIKEIERVLRPGGVCYFGARNRFFPMDGHYPIPFLAFIPKKVSNFLVRHLLRKREYDINLFSLPELRQLVKNFKVKDYTLQVFADPGKFFMPNWIRFLMPLARVLYFLIPNYVWLLIKK